MTRSQIQNCSQNQEKKSGKMDKRSRLIKKNKNMVENNPISQEIKCSMDPKEIKEGFKEFRMRFGDHPLLKIVTLQNFKKEWKDYVNNGAEKIENRFQVNGKMADNLNASDVLSVLIMRDRFLFNMTKEYIGFILSDKEKGDYGMKDLIQKRNGVYHLFHPISH